MNCMVAQSLMKYAEYNDLITGVYSKLKISSFRNNLNTFWFKNNLKILDNSINDLISLNVWTSNEMKFLNKLKSLISFKPKNDSLVTISVENMGELIELSVDSLIERDVLVQKEIYGTDNYVHFKDALYLLGANEKLLKLIKSKLADNQVSQNEVNSLNEIASSLMQSYLFISGKIKEKLYLKDSLKKIKEIWRGYHSLEEIEVV